MRSMRVGKIPIINWRDCASIDFFDIAARENPIPTQGRQPLYWVKRHGPSRTGTIIAPGTAGVVNADRLVHVDLAGHCFGRRERDLAKRNTNVGMNFAGDENFTALWKAVGDAVSVPIII